MSAWIAVRSSFDATCKMSNYRASPLLIADIQSGRSIDKILFQRNLSGDAVAEIRYLAKEKNIPVQLVPAERLFALTRANHQGVIAFASAVQYLELEDVIAHTFESGEDPLFLMLDGITDVRNIGAMSRSALCCGAQALIIPDKGVGALNEEALKSSAGALSSIQVCRVNSLLKAIDTLHLHGIQVYASEMNAPQKVYEVDWNQPSCMVMGSEGRGVQSYLAKAADGHFSIPMAGKFDSFNVSVAAGITLYEAMKQRLVST